jgi:hypothetical protein
MNLNPLRIIDDLIARFVAFGKKTDERSRSGEFGKWPWQQDYGLWPWQRRRKPPQ